jgi:hypothetical protein
METSRKWSELTEAAWISRFWAFYQRLSEPLKEGFTALAESVDKEVVQNTGGERKPKKKKVPREEGVMFARGKK